LPYSNDYYSRVGDGWYAEKANSMETVVGQLSMKPSVQIPQRSASGQWNPSTTFKCNWADVLFSGTSTAGVSGSEIQFTNLETATITVTAILAGIDKWSKLSWQTSGDGELECTVNGTGVTNGQDLTALDLTDPTITIVFAATGDVNLTSLTPEIMLTKYDENSIMIEQENVNELTDDLNHIDTRINVRLCQIENPTRNSQISTGSLTSNAQTQINLSSYAPANWISFKVLPTSYDARYLVLNEGRYDSNPVLTAYNPTSNSRSTSFWVNWFYYVTDD